MSEKQKYILKLLRKIKEDYNKNFDNLIKTVEESENFEDELLSILIVSSSLLTMMLKEVQDIQLRLIGVDVLINDTTEEV